MTLPTITALPTPPNRASSPSTFASDADAFLGALPTFRTELNAYGVALNGEAIGEWETVGSDVATTSGSSVTFANIPATYRDLRFQFIGTSSSTGGNLRIEFSSDGVSYSSVITLIAGTGGSDAWYGDILIADYTALSFGARATFASLGSTPAATTTTSSNVVVRLAASLTHVRFSVSTGNFDAGSIRLRAR